MEILYPYPRWKKINLAAMSLSGRFRVDNGLVFWAAITESGKFNFFNLPSHVWLTSDSAVYTPCKRQSSLRQATPVPKIYGTKQCNSQILFLMDIGGYSQ